MREADKASRARFRVFLAGTEFFREPGGIQYVNRELLRMLMEFARRTPMNVEVFSLNDLAGGLPVEFEFPTGFQIPQDRKSTRLNSSH